MKRFVWLGAVVLLVVVLWSGAWFVVSGLIRDNVAALASADGLSSPRLACATLGVSGFPFRFDVTCAGAELTSADVTVTVPELRASLLVYRPTHVLGFVRSPLAISDAFTGSRSEITFTDLSFSASLTGWRIGRVSLVGSELVWSDTLFAPTLLASSARLEAHLLDIPERHDPARASAALAAYVSASQLSVPLLQMVSTEAEIEAEIDGVPDDIRTFGAPEPLRRWQAAGGRLQLVAVKAREGESFIDGSGTLALDAAGRLEGQVQFTSRGLAERTAVLIADPWRAILVGEQRPDGSFSQTLAVRAGVIFAGLVPAIMVPPLF